MQRYRFSNIHENRADKKERTDQKARRTKREKRKHCLVCTINNKKDGRARVRQLLALVVPASITGIEVYTYYIFNVVKLLNTSRILTARVLKIVHIFLLLNPAIKLKIGKVKRMERKKHCLSYMWESALLGNGERMRIRVEKKSKLYAHKWILNETVVV